MAVNVVPLHIQLAGQALLIYFASFEPIGMLGNHRINRPDMRLKQHLFTKTFAWSQDVCVVSPMFLLLLGAHAQS